MKKNIRQVYVVSTFHHASLAVALGQQRGIYVASPPVIIPTAFDGVQTMSVETILASDSKIKRIIKNIQNFLKLSALFIRLQGRVEFFFFTLSKPWARWFAKTLVTLRRPINFVEDGFGSYIFAPPAWTNKSCCHHWGVAENPLIPARQYRKIKEKAATKLYYRELATSLFQTKLLSLGTDSRSVSIFLDYTPRLLSQGDKLKFEYYLNKALKEMVCVIQTHPLFPTQLGADLTSESAYPQNLVVNRLGCVEALITHLFEDCGVLSINLYGIRSTALYIAPFLWGKDVKCFDVVIEDSPLSRGPLTITTQKI